LPLKKTKNPDVWETKRERSDSCAFFIIGLILLVSGFSLLWVFVKAAPTSASNYFIGVPFGVSIIFAGLAFLLGRRGMIIDRKKKMVIKWRGFLFPMFRSEISLDAFNRITISQEEWTGENAGVIYPIRLAADSESVEVDVFSDYQSALRLGHDFAQFLSLPLVDTTAEAGKENRNPGSSL
jgi:hypothetical protein